MNLLLGTELRHVDQQHVLMAFVHRFTMEHEPDWARVAMGKYRPQFKDDADWLASTRFWVRADGYLDQRFKTCHSLPTWPQGTGLNTKVWHPVTFVVSYIEPHDGIATCGTCGRSWDDTLSTSVTPTPAARCPFEYQHGEEP